MATEISKARMIQLLLIVGGAGVILGYQIGKSTPNIPLRLPDIEPQVAPHVETQPDPPDAGE